MVISRREYPGGKSGLKLGPLREEEVSRELNWQWYGGDTITQHMLSTSGGALC